ncbi:hypothetical protein NLG97_g7433 [Lecanicillium saksenae]|uniref:Uncharacterized protein n=1 Tax=Lecanicillium saksenae TaxID=468837 RepID=A0ACC1QPD2_9HYPO|nr:hypothetical protein NLG97_g7433 [Lecanicillium saksenae]
MASEGKVGVEGVGDGTVGGGEAHAQVGGELAKHLGIGEAHGIVTVEGARVVGASGGGGLVAVRGRRLSLGHDGGGRRASNGIWQAGTVRTQQVPGGLVQVSGWWPVGGNEVAATRDNRLAVVDGGGPWTEGGGYRDV